MAPTINPTTPSSSHRLSHTLLLLVMPQPAQFSSPSIIPPKTTHGSTNQLFPYWPAYNHFQPRMEPTRHSTTALNSLLEFWPWKSYRLVSLPSSYMTHRSFMNYTTTSHPHHTRHDTSFDHFTRLHPEVSHTTYIISPTHTLTIAPPLSNRTHILSILLLKY